jgi:SPP1 gp7 family putative phage head morphogenesis protein
MKIDDWYPVRRNEMTYTRAIKALMADLIKIVVPLDTTDPLDIIQAIKSYYNGDFFREGAFAAASRMITVLAAQNATTWRQATTEGTRGRMLYESLKEEVGNTSRQSRIVGLIEENAKLISSIPEDLAFEAADLIKEEAYKGRRPKAIASELREQFPDVARSRINLIARTETSKAWTVLTQTRAEALGLNWYIWRTSKDARVRNSHRHMEGVLCNWNDPPSPEELDHQKRTYGHYAPGSIFNCRCIAQPIVNWNRVEWPTKVYWAGSIQGMTRSEFEQIHPISRAA